MSKQKTDPLVDPAIVEKVEDLGIIEFEDGRVCQRQGNRLVELYSQLRGYFYGQYTRAQGAKRVSTGGRSFE